MKTAKEDAQREGKQAQTYIESLKRCYVPWSLNSTVRFAPRKQYYEQGLGTRMLMAEYLLV